VQHRHVCWRGRAETACAALYPRPDEAMDAHEQRIPGTHGQDLRPAGEKAVRSTIGQRTPNPPNWLSSLLTIIARSDGGQASGVEPAADPARRVWPIRAAMRRCDVVRPEASMVQQAAFGDRLVRRGSFAVTPSDEDVPQRRTGILRRCDRAAWPEKQAHRRMAATARES
jgi:hypothetical protein